MPSNVELPGLTAHELFSATLEALRFHFWAEEVALPFSALAEIDNKSTIKETRKWYACYSRVFLLPSQGGRSGRRWAVSLGLPADGQPSRGFGCDLAALPVVTAGKSDESVVRAIHDGLESGGYYHNSILIAFLEGTIGLPPDEGRFNGLVEDTLRHQLTEFIVREAEFTQPEGRNKLKVVSQETLYHHRALALLWDTVRRAMMDS